MSTEEIVQRTRLLDSEIKVARPARGEQGIAPIEGGESRGPLAHREPRQRTAGLRAEGKCGRTVRPGEADGRFYGAPAWSGNAGRLGPQEGLAGLPPRLGLSLCDCKALCGRRSCRFSGRPVAVRDRPREDTNSLTCSLNLSCFSLCCLSFFSLVLEPSKPHSRSYLSQHLCSSQASLLVFGLNSGGVIGVFCVGGPNLGAMFQIESNRC